MTRLASDNVLLKSYRPGMWDSTVTVFDVIDSLRQQA